LAAARMALSDMSLAEQRATTVPALYTLGVVKLPREQLCHTLAAAMPVRCMARLEAGTGSGSPAPCKGLAARCKDSVRPCRDLLTARVARESETRRVVLPTAVPATTSSSRPRSSIEAKCESRRVPGATPQNRQLGRCPRHPKFHLSNLSP
jgi:hypothetical protein